MSADKIRDYYSTEVEKNRLESELFKLEGIRTREIIDRYLLKNNLHIIDIGGGAGYYAFWLQQKGHHVTLVDLSPTNIELVKEYSQRSGIQLTHFEVGDATHLNFADGQFDMVLLLGPLYHLIERKDRIIALTEAKRILKPGGLLLSAVISRYASLFDGFKRNLVNDSRFENILTDDLFSGVHLNETDNFDYFTTAYFHKPTEIKEELNESGLTFKKLIAIESFGWVIDDFSRKSKDNSYMDRLLHFVRELESNEDLIAMSPHIIAVAQKG